MLVSDAVCATSQTALHLKVVVFAWAQLGQWVLVGKYLIIIDHTVHKAIREGHSIVDSFKFQNCPHNTDVTPLLYPPLIELSGLHEKRNNALLKFRPKGVFMQQLVQHPSIHSCSFINIANAREYITTTLEVVTSYQWSTHQWNHSVGRFTLTHRTQHTHLNSTKELNLLTAQQTWNFEHYKCS